MRCVRDLIACIETGKEPNCSGEDGRHALEIALALRESHRRGGTRVALPLADRSLHIRSLETLHGDDPPSCAAPVPKLKPQRRQPPPARRAGVENRTTDATLLSASHPSGVACLRGSCG